MGYNMTSCDCPTCGSPAEYEGEQEQAMKETFRAKKFRPSDLTLIASCDATIEDFQSQDLRLTLRQLYYQLVTRNEIPNTPESYKALGKLVSDARLAGLLDWDAIEDRVRQPVVPSEWSSVSSLVRSAVAAFRLPRWEGQEHYVELWVEKDALAGVLEPIADAHHVTLMVNRGYSSQSAMYAAAQRINEGIGTSGDRDGHILYLGDHDPSGEDMVRDVQERLEMFGVEYLTTHKIALTMDQVREHRPPPNPAKITDPRAAAYIAEHGRRSWEVDALPPAELTRIVRREIRRYLDQSKYDAVIKREDAGKAALEKAAKNVDKPRSKR